MKSMQLYILRGFPSEGQQAVSSVAVNGMFQVFLNAALFIFYIMVTFGGKNGQ